MYVIIMLKSILYLLYVESFHHSCMMPNFVKGYFSTYWDDETFLFFILEKFWFLRMNTVDEKSKICKFVGVISLSAQSLKREIVVIKSQCLYLYWTSHTFKIILYQLSHLQTHQGSLFISNVNSFQAIQATVTTVIKLNNFVLVKCKNYVESANFRTELWQSVCL